MTAVEGKVRSAHAERFGVRASAYSAPARVNLIGEHTDYTGGLVMPMAIGFHTVAAVSPRSDDKAVFSSANFGETRELTLDLLEEPPVARSGHWSDYPAGVVWSLRQAGIPVAGFEMSLEGDVPLGAG